MNQFAFDHRQEHHYAATMKIKKPKNKKAIPSKSTSKKSSTQEKLHASAAKKHLYTVDDILMNVRPTPMVRGVLTREEKIEKISVKFAEIMKILNLDLADDSLKDTPRRVAKMYVNEIFAGLFPENFPRISTIDNKMNYNQLIVVQEIQCLSFCEHHFLTIDGVATVAYIPEKKVIGLSKINRIVKFFSRRPQVQERLTKQIADCLQYVLETPHVAVHINAKHYCVITRGVEDSHSATSTCDLRGDFLDLPETRSEFLGHCKVRF